MVACINDEVVIVRGTRVKKTDILVINGCRSALIGSRILTYIKNKIRTRTKDKTQVLLGVDLLGWDYWELEAEPFRPAYILVVFTGKAIVKKCFLPRIVFHARGNHKYFDFDNHQSHQHSYYLSFLLGLMPSCYLKYI